MLSFLVFMFGLGIGSFLNAVIYRLALAGGLVSHVRDRERKVPASPFRGRSFCPRCGHTLSWQDLIPLLSFVLLRARCRYCKKPISWQYPLVEISTAFVFLLSFKFQVSNLNQVSSFEVLSIFYLWVIASLLIVLFVYDLRHYILPDKILLPAIFVVCIWYFVSSIFFNFYTRYEILNTIYAGVAAAGFFFVIFALSKGRAMGFGDVKLAAFMGLFLGWPSILSALFTAFMAGAAVGIVLILMKKKGMRSEVPFGPFLIAGTFVALFFGKLLVDRYIGFLLT